MTHVGRDTEIHLKLVWTWMPANLGSICGCTVLMELADWGALVSHKQSLNEQKSVVQGDLDLRWNKKGAKFVIGSTYSGILFIQRAVQPRVPAVA